EQVIGARHTAEALRCSQSIGVLRLCDLKRLAIVHTGAMSGIGVNYAAGRCRTKHGIGAPGWRWIVSVGVFGTIGLLEIHIGVSHRANRHVRSGRRLGIDSDDQLPSIRGGTISRAVRYGAARRTCASPCTTASTWSTRTPSFRFSATRQLNVPGCVSNAPRRGVAAHGIRKAFGFLLGRISERVDS